MKELNIIRRCRETLGKLLDELIHVDKPNFSILVGEIAAHVDNNVVGFVSFRLYLTVFYKGINLFSDN